MSFMEFCQEICQVNIQDFFEKLSILVIDNTFVKLVIDGVYDHKNIFFILPLNGTLNYDILISQQFLKRNTFYLIK